jgi:hypothetical protein
MPPKELIMAHQHPCSCDNCKALYEIAHELREIVKILDRSQNTATGIGITQLT